MFSDNEDKMVRLLEQIAANTGSIDELGDGPQQEINIQGETVSSRVGTIDPKDLLVIETDDLDASNDEGAVTVDPGEQATIVGYRPGWPFAVLAVGANDEADVQYQLRVDGQTPVGGTTNSPMGTVNNPFSFVDELGGAPHAEKRVDLIAYVDQSASAPVDLVGRLYLEAINP